MSPPLYRGRREHVKYTEEITRFLALHHSVNLLKIGSVYSAQIESTVVLKLTTIFLILSFAAVVLSVATEDARDAAAGVGAFKLTRQAHMDIWRAHA